MNELLDKKVNFVLPNNIFYLGKVISEDKIFFVIIDKFGKEIRLNKSHIISMEVKANGEY